MIEFQELNWVEFNLCCQCCLKFLLHMPLLNEAIGFDPIKYILSLNLLSHGLKHFDWF